MIFQVTLCVRISITSPLLEANYDCCFEIIILKKHTAANYAKIPDVKD